MPVTANAPGGTESVAWIVAIALASLVVIWLLSARDRPATRRSALRTDRHHDAVRR